MQTAEETTQAGSVSRQLKQTSGWASVGVGRTGTAPKSPGGCGGVGWSWSGSNTLGSLCVSVASSQHTFHRVCPRTFPPACFA